MTTFIINGKTIKAKPITFNTVCEFEDMGISIDEFGKRKLSLAQVYVAVSMGVSREEAGAEIEKDPNSIESIMIAMGEEIDKSDFFRNLNKTEEKSNTKTQSKKSE